MRCRWQSCSSVLKHAAERDHLTGCFNRRYLHDHLMGGQWIDRTSEVNSLSVVLCDIDQFKHIDDAQAMATAWTAWCVWRRTDRVAAAGLNRPQAFASSTTPASTNPSISPSL